MKPSCEHRPELYLGCRKTGTWPAKTSERAPFPWGFLQSSAAPLDRRHPCLLGPPYLGLHLSKHRAGAAHPHHTGTGSGILEQLSMCPKASISTLDKGGPQQPQ